METFKDMDSELFKNFINELADQSGKYIAESFDKDNAVDLKADKSPVTEIDRNTELMLRESIKRKFPSHGIIGEEFGRENDSAEFVWVIDPIDGTKSFITGVPLFGTIVALLKNGEPILGLIDQPILRQRCIGNNFKCWFNGKETRACAHNTIDGATILTSDNRHAENDYNAENFRELVKKAAIFRSWGDCFGYMLIARRLAHLMLDARLEVWDLMPLLPILKGCGATFSDWHGGTNYGKKGLVVGCTKELHEYAVKFLNK